MTTNITIKARLILAMTMLWAGVAAFAQMPAKDGVLLDGEFVYKNGTLDLTLWGLGGNFSDPSVRGLAISVGQLCAVNPATGATIADTNNLVPAVVRTMEVKNNGYFVNGNVGINTNPSSVSTEKLKVAGSIQSTLAGSAGGYMFADTTNTHRESRLETAYALVPVGGVVAFYKFVGWFLPTNFVACNGQTINDSDSPLYGKAVPDLNGQAATIEGNTSGLGAFVGANTINLTTAQMPAHSHGGSTATDGAHTHDSTSTDGAHHHTYNRPDDSVDRDAAENSTWNDSVSSYNTSTDGAHSHSVLSDGSEHSHAISSQGSNADIDNRQRSCQLTWIIRIK